MRRPKSDLAFTCLQKQQPTPRHHPSLGHDFPSLGTGAQQRPLPEPLWPALGPSTTFTLGHTTSCHRSRNTSPLSRPSVTQLEPIRFPSFICYFFQGPHVPTGLLTFPHYSLSPSASHSLWRPRPASCTLMSHRFLNNTSSRTSPRLQSQTRFLSPALLPRVTAPQVPLFLPTSGRATSQSSLCISPHNLAGWAMNNSD